MRTMRFKKTAALSAAAALVALAGPANAAPPWNVTVGAATAPVPFSAYTKAPISFIVNGPAGQVGMSCGAASAAGIIIPGSSTTGLRVAEIQGTSWSQCIGPGGLAMNVWSAPPVPGVPTSGKWPLNLTGTTGPTWAGNISNINARVVSKLDSGGVPSCAFTVTGRANATFNTAQVSGNNNYTQTLTVNQPFTTPNLTVSNITGCFGQLVAGNPASFTGSFKVYNSVALVGIS